MDADSPSAHGALEVRAVQGRAALHALAPAWRALAQACFGARDLCNGPEWVLAHAACFARDEDVFVHTLHDTRGALVAVLPFKHEPRRGRFALRRVQFLADGSFDSDYNDVPCVPGSERAVAAAAIDLFARKTHADAVLLAMVRRDSPFLAAVCAELVARDLPVRSSPASGGAFDLHGSFEDHVASLGSRMRSKVRQALRRSEAATFERLTNPSELAAWLDALFDLHGRRWRAVGRAGSFADERRRTFYATFLPEELRAGRLEFARLVRDGRPIALQLGVLRGTTYHQIQEGYDPALEEERPGTQLRARMLKDLVERGVRRYDFMEGFSQHKADWGAEEQRCVTLSFALPRVRAKLVFALKNAFERYRESSS
jgi:CelD/BcsL family acetyltransferase involved in cellulose biosynthesis